VPFISVFAQVVGRADSASRRPWGSVGDLSEIARTAGLPSGVSADAIAQQLFAGAGLGATQAVAALPRLLGYVAAHVHASARRVEQSRRLALTVPDFLLNHSLTPTTGRVREPKLADAHVHFGGAMWEKDLLNSLLRTDLRTIPDIRFHDASGAEWSVRSVLRYLRRLTICAQFDVRDGCLETAYWDSIQLREPEDTSPSRDRLGSSPLQWGMPDLEAMPKVDCHELDVFHLVETIRRASSPGWSAHAIDAAFHLLCLFHTALASPQRSSLDRFVDQFDRASRLAKAGMAKSRRFESAMSWAGEGLGRMELRKTYASGVTSTSSDIAADLEAFREAIRRMPRDSPTVSMPVTFLKEHLAPGSKFPLGEQLRVAEAFCRAFEDLSLQDRGLIAAIDVVGAEEAQPNWIFVAAFNQISRRIMKSYPADAGLAAPGRNRYPIEFSAHAGEQYATPSAGLRAIHEYVDRVAWLTRIGHGLALGADHAAQMYSQLEFSSIPVLTLLENGLWARATIGHAAFDALPGASALDELVKEILGPDHDRASADLWYSMRYDVDVLERHFGLDLASAEGDCELGPVEPHVTASFEAYLVRSAPGFDARRLGDSAMTAAARAGLEELEPAIYEALRPRVIERIAERAVLIEVCPSSNCALRGLPILEHPLADAFEELECTINSDDPAVFGSRALEELTIVRHLNPIRAEVFKLNTWDATARGVDDTLMNALRD